MAILPHFTVSEYNNVGRMNDSEHAVYLLNCLEALAASLVGSELQSGHLERMHQRYAEGVPQAICDQVQQVAEDMLDRLRNVDPAYHAECDRRARELHDTYELHVSYAADSIKGGYC